MYTIKKDNNYIFFEAHMAGWCVVNPIQRNDYITLISLLCYKIHRNKFHYSIHKISKIGKKTEKSEHFTTTFYAYSAMQVKCETVILFEANI